MKVARKKGKIISGIAVFTLAFSTSFLLMRGNIKQTFAEVEEKLEDTKIIKTIENIKNNDEKEANIKENEQEIKNTTSDIKKQLEKNKIERRELEAEIKKNTELKKNVEEAKKRLAELEKEYQNSLEKTPEVIDDTLEEIDYQGHGNTESNSE